MFSFNQYNYYYKNILNKYNYYECKPHRERYILKNQRSDGCCTEIWFAIMYK